MQGGDRIVIGKEEQEECREKLMGAARESLSGN